MEELPQLRASRALQRKRMTGRENIPVQVIDGIAPVVLNVPAERGEAHPYI